MKGVEDALGRLEGVLTVKIDLQANLVTITPRPGVEFPLEKIPEAIQGAGYRPAEMRIRASGTLDGVEPQRFQIRGWSGPILVKGCLGPAGKTTIAARVDYSVRPVQLEVDAER